MKRACLFLFILYFLCAGTGLAQRYVVSGYIVDAETKETLIGATIMHRESGYGVVTDIYGYFQFAGLKAGKHVLDISFIGYEAQMMEVEIRDHSLVLHEIRLSPKTLTMDEVTIIAARPDIAADRQVETSMMELSPKTIQSIPTAGNDVFSAIKFLPGVDRTEPFSPLYSVRGGDPGENAVMLDGIMIYNPYHSSISSGIFNTQIIKNVDLLIGGFGAEYGGRNSSVMYISTKDGNSSDLHGEVEPSTFHSKIFLEFPGGKQGSAIVAGRYYYDIFSEFIFQSNSYFYDFNVSYTTRLGNKHRLTAKYFQSRDRNNLAFNTFYKIFGNTINFDIYDDFEFSLENRWKNYAGTLIHKWVLNPRMYLRTQVYYSVHQSDNLSQVDFKFDITGEEIDTLKLDWRTNSIFTNRIGDLCAKSFLNILLFRNNNLRIGGEYNYFNFENNAIINDIDQGGTILRPQQYALFIEDKLQLGPLIIRPGLRLSCFDSKDIHYEPRFNAVLALPFKMRLKAAWGTYYQYVISMNTNEVEMNQAVDYYYPLQNYDPSKSVHYILGLEKQLNAQSILSLDLYYKDIQRIYTFDVNETSNGVLSLSEKLQGGTGEAYGAELMLRGGIGRLSGWLSYGLSWANRAYPLSGGMKYPYDYNRRHTVKIVSNYAISNNLEYNVSFLFMSGVYRSIEQFLQNYYYYNPDNEDISFFPMWGSEGKNTALMPPVLNLDMSIKKRLRSGFGKNIADKFGADESYLTVTLKNILFFRRNVEYYYPISGLERWEGKYLPIGMNLFPIMGLSYTIKF